MATASVFVNVTVINYQHILSTVKPSITPSINHPTYRIGKINMFILQSYIAWALVSPHKVSKYTNRRELNHGQARSEINLTLCSSSDFRSRSCPDKAKIWTAFEVVAWHLINQDKC